MPVASKRKLPVILNEDEIQRILAVPNKRYPTGLRNFCILRTMIAAGLRCSEIISLKPYDIDYTTGKLHVRDGKGGRDRVLWIGEQTLSDLQLWLEKRGERVVDLDRNTPLFCTLKGGTIKSAYLRAMVYRIRAKAKIDKPISPHSFRHFYATQLYSECGNLRIVQKALAHSFLSTTLIYTHHVDSAFEKALREFRK